MRKFVGFLIVILTATLVVASYFLVPKMLNNDTDTNNQEGGSNIDTSTPEVEPYSGGSITLSQTGVSATISTATLDGLVRENASGDMQSFSINPSMTPTQINDLAGYKSWNNVGFLIDGKQESQKTLSFTITNNSTDLNENIFVN